MTGPEIVARFAEFERRNSAPATVAQASEQGVDAAYLVPAAVLVPILQQREPSILLTLRAARLSAHAGQVSFPGGRMEPGESAEEAALREAEEEVGLARGLPQLVGRMADHVTGTGYRITPVVGLLAGPPRLSLAEGEVAEAFELPLTTLLDPDAPQRRQTEHQGRLRQFWVWPHERHYIWGATAAILVNLARILRGG